MTMAPSSTPATCARSPAPTAPVPAQQGFTLIEVLVALAIVGITLTAGLQATGALTRHAERQRLQWLAQLCADNALVQVRLSTQMPPIGRNSGGCQQVGQTLEVVQDVSPTPNPSFRRVVTQVHTAADSDDGRRMLLQLSTVVGRY